MELLTKIETKKDTPYVSGDTYISKDEAKRIYDKMGYDFDLDQFVLGMNTELEHQDVTGGDLEQTAKIAAAHIREVPDYYTKLKQSVESKTEDVGGLVGTDGSINGAPKPKDVKKMRNTLDRENRND